MHTGTVVDFIGNREYAGYGVVDVTYSRRDQFDEIQQRFQRLLVVERLETQSVAGKYGFAAQIITALRPFLARTYKAVHDDKLWYYDKRCKAEAMAMRDWMRNDMSHIDKIMAQFKGAAFITIPWAPSAVRVLEAYSDANRPKKTGRYAGMGAFVSFGSYLKYWHIRLPEKIRIRIPVHVTERLATEITIAVMPELQHCRLRQWVDNMAAVCALQRRRSNDPRFQDLQIIHEHQTGDRKIETCTEWIDTKSNLWADLISRGELQQFERLAREAGYREIVAIDIARDNIPADLPDMFTRLLTMTELLPVKIRCREITGSQQSTIPTKGKTVKTKDQPTCPTHQVARPTMNAPRRRTP